MKTTKLIYLFLVLVTLAGCSSKETPKTEDPTGDGDGVVEIKSITLSLNKQKIEEGGAVMFFVKADTGEDLSTKVKYFVNDTEVSSRNYTPDAAGTYSIKATYQDLTSNVVSLEVEARGPRFQKHPVIEDYTGTWCGWCPRVAYAIEQVEATTNLAIPIAIHNGDTMATSYEAELRSAFNVTGFPTAYVDRDVTWTYPEPSNVSQITNLADVDATAGLYFESSLDGTTINLKVKAQFGVDFDGEVKLAVIILEDGIIEDQKNYTSYYNGDDVVVGFVHDHVLRYAVTPILGEVIPEDKTKKNEIYTKEYSLAVPSVIANTDKMSFVVMILDKDKKVINARSIKVNETADFEVK